jgi:hypothetical protein
MIFKIERSTLDRSRWYISDPPVYLGNGLSFLIDHKTSYAHKNDGCIQIIPGDGFLFETIKIGPLTLEHSNDSGMNYIYELIIEDLFSGHKLTETLRARTYETADNESEEL